MRQNIIKMLWLRIILRRKKYNILLGSPVRSHNPFFSTLTCISVKDLLPNPLPMSQIITKSRSFEYLNVLKVVPLMSFSTPTGSLAAYVVLSACLMAWHGTLTYLFLVITQNRNYYYYFQIADRKIKKCRNTKVT